MLIVGAGMAGCLAGILNPKATIIEAAPRYHANHDAVLRFRSDAISQQIGIPFKKVIVRKGIWSGSKFLNPDIHLANNYSLKTTNLITDRSIWNLESVERWVAPSNFHEIMEEMCRSRINYGVKFNKRDAEINQEIISTIPMNKMCEIMEYESEPGEGFHYAEIEVNRYKIAGCDVNQTVYYPNPRMPHYRATITGDNLIVESISSLRLQDIEDVCLSFGITTNRLTPIKEHHKQKYGKISPIDDLWRKNFIFWLTSNYEIFSLGRFATWRNILLDDVLKDIYQIKRMITLTEYDRWKLS